ncbi:hypothetical protein [Serratia sp. (in: enterobacteria)]|uniref:hypothetical protein n=1 Tax=Serratia sp. (in: enterobacteria) TaxID=616 RepID=UPI0039890702
MWVNHFTRHRTMTIKVRKQTLRQRSYQLLFGNYMSQEMQRYREQRHCVQCERGGHETEAKFCKFCGAALPPLSVKSTG